MDSPIHSWFELSYAQYLTIPRSVLQSMPVEWQERFVACLVELDDKIDWRPKEGRYWVQLRNAKGRYVYDPLHDYKYGKPIQYKSNDAFYIRHPGNGEEIVCDSFETAMTSWFEGFNIPYKKLCTGEKEPFALSYARVNSYFKVRSEKGKQ